MRIQTQRLLIRLHTLGIIFSIHKDIAHVMIDLRQTLLAFRCIFHAFSLPHQKLILLGRLRKLLLLIKRISQIIGTFDRARINFQGFTIFYFRLCIFFRTVQIIAFPNMLPLSFLGKQGTASYQKQGDASRFLYVFHLIYHLREQLNLLEYTILTFKCEEIYDQKEERNPRKDLELLIIFRIDFAI